MLSRLPVPTRRSCCTSTREYAAQAAGLRRTSSQQEPGSLLWGPWCSVPSQAGCLPACEVILEACDPTTSIPPLASVIQPSALDSCPRSTILAQLLTPVDQVLCCPQQPPPHVPSACCQSTRFCSADETALAAFRGAKSATLEPGPDAPAIDTQRLFLLAPPYGGGCHRTVPATKVLR